jgi:hypothetical protein
MAKFQLQPGEQVVRQGSALYLKGRLKGVPGNAYLTDRRFVHTSKLGAMAVGGLVGALMSSGKIDIELSLEAIARLARGRQGRNDAVLAITLADGQEHRFLADPAEWVPAFSHALSLHAARLFEHEPGSWSVAWA